jgi:hypothetical protein
MDEISGKYMREMINARPDISWLENEERDYLEDLGINGRLLLKYI